MHTKIISLAWRARTLLCAAFAASSATALAQSTAVFTQQFKIESGTRYDLTTSANQNRGIAVNPVTGNVLYPSTTGGSNHVTIVDGTTGAEIKALNATGVGGGNLLNLVSVRVAADGAVYACNVSQAGGNLRIYRWPSEVSDDPPALILNQPVPTRWGDNMDVRGSGTNTQIAVSGSGGTSWALAVPADDTLTNTWLVVTNAQPTGTSSGFATKGIAFAGTNNSVFTKLNGASTVYEIGFSLNPQTNWLIRSLSVGSSTFVGIDYGETNGFKFISGVIYSGTADTNFHRTQIYEISTSPATLVYDGLIPGPYFVGGVNGIAATDISTPGRIAFLEPNNGLSVVRLAIQQTWLAPSIRTEPAGLNILETGYGSMNVEAIGTAPLSYQWYFNTNTPVPGGTGAVLNLTNLTTAMAGAYSVIVSNGGGKATSAVAMVTVQPGAFTSVSSPLWKQAPGSQFALSTGDTQRGLAYNPVTGHLVLVSRTPTNGVHILNAATGAYLSSLNMDWVTYGGTFAVNLVGVSDSGEIYVANLTTTGTGFTLYKWDSEDPAGVAYMVYNGDPGVGRIGDTLAVRGAGMNTEIIAASRNGNQVVLFKPDFSTYSFSANVLTVADAPAGFAGLGLAFGPGNTFYGKAGTFYLRQVGYTFDAGSSTYTASVLRTLTAGVDQINAIGMDMQNQIVGGVALQNNDNLTLYDVWSTTTTNVPAMEQEFFATDNANVNGTGAVAFDVAGGRVFALDTNNGLLALRYAPVLRSALQGSQLVLKWYGPARLQRAATANGSYADVSGASSPYTVPAGGVWFYRLTN